MTTKKKKSRRKKRKKTIRKRIKWLSKGTSNKRLRTL